MEAWLKTKNITFRFPLVPEDIEVNKSYNIITERLVNGEEISMYAGSDLKRTSLSSHFPADKERTYLDFYDFPEPIECVRIIEEIAKSQSEIRYIVTESEINMSIKITEFKRGTEDATGDIYFTLGIIEYNPPKPVSWTPPDPKVNHGAGDKVHHRNKPYNLKKRPDFPLENNRKIHIVKKNDCLWDIAHKYYKNGAKYKIIKNNVENQKNYPSLKKSNVIYTNWKLVIP
ncbi:LysM peptidoglycan-binding domain-containing protein [Peptostreptococcus canis]|uniref:LysM peptidoglycan-binding domain-containing protein n=1 Tax=Peptostreptococcus canis TaxID=1159213 RepID=A0ABR6TME6_9FIRM|nr:LysM peptidoglycan-binding domain-containing protein [Peptostreptococcus canis]MBC2576582.1 LysM peptidoglycan-binding domain-containing protein [Peptostreptococcus canis]MBP1998769.1 hypothetical protein [Peptostreptococcus canis]